MNSLIVLAAVLCSMVSAIDVNGTTTVKDLQMCSYTATCTANGVAGVCVDTNAGCCTGTKTSGLCPGASNIQCCTDNKCSTPWGSGVCESTSACSGDSYSGYCTGPSSIQCCVGGGGGGNNDDGGSSPSNGELGVDISQALSSSTASCFKSNGVSFIVPRGYKSNGAVDTNACSSLTAAKNAGIAKRDVYMFPDPDNSKSAATQVSELVSAMKGCGSAWSGRVWLDIEGSQYWMSDSSANKAWYQQLVDACKSTAGSRNCGVYSSASQWSAIFGSSSYSYGSDMPLWYAHYDNKQTFSDFSSFGGWRSPSAKQYQGDVTLCSFGVDMDWAPSF